MQLKLELLAPARNSDIGIAAIDCGADAVYIAGPSFGARAAAGNPVEDIARLCRYAHRFGVRIYVTLNTLLEKEEFSEAENLIWQYYNAGADALIVQDMQVLKMNLPPMELHASTQTVVRTPLRAKELEAAGFKRIILERQLSIEQIKAIRENISCDIEFFVHGALCVGYSGQCYLSEELTGRSANRGCCAQPCRSRYNLVDSSGNILLHDKPILSLKDYRLDSHIGELIEAGVTSFKIEGRLKNSSYVKNTVLHYRDVLDRYISLHPQYRKASCGRIVGGFTPDPNLTFNRGYTKAWIDGTRGKWNSTDGAKSLGEYIGEISAVGKGWFTVKSEGRSLSNGDGLTIVRKNGELTGMRIETASESRIVVKETSDISAGDRVYRNNNLKFEHELEKNMPQRLIDCHIDYFSKKGQTTVKALTESGISAEIQYEETNPVAEKQEKAVEMIRNQLGKKCDFISFLVDRIDVDKVHFHTAAQLNSVRRELFERIQAQIPVRIMEPSTVNKELIPTNPLPCGELLRTKYCIRYELGICLKYRDIKTRDPLYLINNGRKLKLEFDCKNCEMVVTL